MAVQVLGLGDIQVGNNGAEAEGIVGVQHMDALGSQLVDQVGDEVGIHDIVVLGIAAVQHGSDNHGGIADIVSKQGGLFQAHPVLAVDGTGDRVTVAVQLVLAVVGHADVALGLLGDHLGQLLGSLVVPLSGLENVGELDFQVEIIGGICFGSGSVSSGSLSSRRLGSGLGAAGAEGQNHHQSQQHCKEFFHSVSPFVKRFCYKVCHPPRSI